jgi:glycosyltransferase involved in cell wall biosynthesis
VPVVAPGDGGTGEVVRDGIDGRLVDPADSASLTGAVMELAADPALRARMGAAGRARVLGEFAEKGTSLRTWDEVRSIVEGRVEPRIEARAA